MAGTLYLPTDIPFTDPATARISTQWLRFLNDVQAGLSSVPWASIDFTGSSFADIVTRSASTLNTGTLPLGRLSGITTTELAAAAGITLAQLASMTDARLLGRSAGGNGIPQEITVGSGLTLAAGSLSATATASPLSLLYANSGSDTSAAATTVDSIALTGFTAKDTLIVELTLNSVTQQTARPHLYHVTDGAILADVLNSASLVIPAGNPGVYGRMEIRQKHTSATAVGFAFCGFDPNLGKVGNTDAGGTALTTTAWTGNWTLGLRHNGVTAGGTFHYSWAVYRMAGQ